MLMRLQNYEVSLRYVPGKHVVLADTLSRAYLTEQDKRPCGGQSGINQYHTLSSERLKHIQRATELDWELQTLKNLILQRWPEVKGHVPLEVAMYFHNGGELSVQNGIIFRE